MEQLCWKCRKARGGEEGCSWFNGFIPVDGWVISNSINGDYIKECPEFVLDEKTSHRWVNGLVRIFSNDLSKKLGMSQRSLFRKGDKELIELAKTHNLDLVITITQKKRVFYIRRINNEIER